MWKTKKADISTNDDAFVLHNAGSKQLKKSEYISELHRFKTKCAECKTRVQRVYRLLEEINTLKDNEVIGVCEHCKRARSLKKTCKRCEFIVSEFKSTYEKTHKERQERFKVWLCRVNHVLQAIVDGGSECEHKLYKDNELDRILKELKEPLHMQEPDIYSFSNLGRAELTFPQNVSKSNEMLKELFSKMEYESQKSVLSSEGQSSSKEYLCKYLRETNSFGSKKIEDSQPCELLKDFSRTLRQEGHENLMRRLLDLSKDLPQELHLNGDLLKEIVEIINTALKQGLPQSVVLQLINKLTELKKTLTDDLSENLNTKVTQTLIDDLNDLQLLGLSRNLNHNLITFLDGLSNFLSHKTTKSLKTERLQSKTKMPQESYLESRKDVAQKIADLNKALTAGVSDENLVQELSSEMHEIIGRMPRNDLNETIKELTNLYKSKAILRKSKTANLELIQGLINDARKARKALGIGPTKVITSDKDKVQNKSIGFSKNVSKDVNKTLRQKYSSSKTIIKTGRVEYLNDRSADSEIVIAKKESKLGKSSFKKPFVSLDKMRKKTGLDTTDKEDVKRYLFENKDIEHTKKNAKKPIGIKQNLPPIRYLKSQSRQKSKELQKDAKELSQYMLIKIQAKEEKFKLKRNRQLAKQEEKQIRKDKQLLMKETKQKKIIQKFSSQDGIVGDQRTEITIFGEPPRQFDIKESDKRGNEPLSMSSAARSTSNYQNGSMKYQLSNEDFIRIGWTVVPEEKIMRKMNIYKMVPANPENGWFDRHKEYGELFYDSGQKLADIDGNGHGHWYYRNGSIALDYYNAQESNIGQRYVVYSAGTEMEGGKIRPRTVLALFDVLGNCVVYDLHGNVRLKYNQSEGILLDKKIGPPGKWKWHTLNDPPVLQRTLVDTYLEEWDPELERLRNTVIGSPSYESEAAKLSHSEMVQIELDNYVKEKTFQLKLKFRPFKIRMKSVKLNEQFSLKIIDQATIYLIYRDGITNLKLNLGMLLKSNVIIDTVISNVGDVQTPYDVRPANTESVDNIQKIIKSVRSVKL